MTSCTLISNASDERFPDNNRGSFINELPEFLENFNNTYKVSLTRLSFENSFNTVRKKSVPDLILKLNQNNLSEKLLGTKTIHTYQIFEAKNENYEDLQDEIYMVIFLKYGKYKTLTELINSLTHFFFTTGCETQIFISQNPFHKNYFIDIHPSCQAVYINNDIMKLLNISPTRTSEFTYEELLEETNQSLPREYSNLTKAKNCSSIFYQLKARYHTIPHELFRSNFFVPKLIKIFVQELFDCIDSSNVSKLLTVCPPPPLYTDCIVYDFEPLNKVSRRLATQFPKNLTVTLCDEEDRPLEFATASPTYLTCDLYSDQNMDEDIFMTMNSSDRDSLALFKTNTNTNFTIKMPKVLTKGNCKKWTIKLLSLSIETKIHNVLEDTQWIKIKSKKDFVKITLDDHYYPTIEHIVQQFSGELKVINEETGDIDLSLELVDSRVLFTNNSSEPVEVILSPILSLLLGYSNTLENWNYFKIDADQNVVCLFEPNLMVSKPKFVKILSNQVSKSIYGNKYQNILGFVPLAYELKDLDNNFHEVQHPLEHEIQQQTLDTIDFKITSDLSDNELSMDSSFPTLLSIVIKKYF